MIDNIVEIAQWFLLAFVWLRIESAHFKLDQMNKRITRSGRTLRDG